MLQIGLSAPPVSHPGPHVPASTPDAQTSTPLTMSPAHAVELARILDQAPSFIAVLRGSDHRIDFFNQAYQRLVGDRVLLNRTVAEAFPELEGQQYLKLLDEIHRTREPHVGRASPFLVRHSLFKAPELVFVDFVYQPLLDADGTVSGVFVQGSEVTDRVLALKNLERLTALLQVIEHQIPTFLYVKDREGRMLYCNPAVSAGVGKPIEEIIGRTDAEFIGPGERTDEIVKHDRHVIDTGATVTLEERIEGSDRIYLSTKAAYRDVDGNVVGLVGVSMDVTEQTRMREALAESRERFRLAESVSTFGSFDFTVDGQRVTWSSTVWAMYGRSGTGGISLQETWDAIHPEDQSRVADQWAQMLAPDAAPEHNYRHRIVRPGGEVRCLVFAVRSIMQGGKVTALSGVVWDETEREQMLDRLNSEDRRKNEFIATLSHELRNTLAPITTAATLLANPKARPDQIAWAQAVIQRQVLHMAALLDDLLDVTRITQGKVSLKNKRVGLASVIEVAIEAVQPLIDRRQHRLTLSLPQPDPQLDVDPIRLAQILSNLLTNAAKYTDPGGQIDLAGEVADGQLVLKVADNGIGLHPELMPTLFEMFAQDEGATDRSEGGLGVGLSLVKGLVELHGGSIRASSGGPGQGSTFTVQLPHSAWESGAAPA